MKRLIQILLLVLFGGGSYLFYQRLFPSDEVQIRHLLTEAAEAASIQSDAGNFSRLAALNRILESCTADIEIVVSARGIEGRTLRGKDELKAAVAGLQATRQGMDIKLKDLGITVAPGRDQATAQFIAQTQIQDSRENVYQEFRVLLVQVDDDWKIRRVEPLKALDI